MFDPSVFFDIYVHTVWFDIRPFPLVGAEKERSNQSFSLLRVLHPPGDSATERHTSALLLLRRSPLKARWRISIQVASVVRWGGTTRPVGPLCAPTNGGVVNSGEVLKGHFGGRVLLLAHPPQHLLYKRLVGY